MSRREQYIKETHYHWKGIHSGQHKRVSSVFSKTFLKKFSRIVELGAAQGAFSMLLAKNGADVHSYEKDADRFRMKTKPKNLKVILKNYNDIEDQVAKLIAKDGRTLVLCDGGSKLSDFSTFSKRLKPDDVIMIHDYGEDSDSFLSTAAAQNWLWGQEASFSSVRAAVETGKLQKWEYDRFLPVFWGAFRKE